MTRSRNILPPRCAWTEADLQLLRSRYPVESTSVIAAALGRKVWSVYNKAFSLGLRKTDAYLASPAACRLRRGDHVGAATRFKKGQVPANKGLRRPGWARGRMSETQFKKGRPAHEARNYLPIGSLRLSKDGYLERKVTDDPSVVPARRWVGVHRLVWESARGPIPRSHAVAFLPGRFSADERLITVDALELVSRAELMKRNTVHNLPKPLAELVQLRGAVVRQINRRTKRENEDHRPA